MHSTTTLLTKVSGFLTGDIVFLLAVFVVLFVACMYLGKGRFISIIVSFYPATLLYKSFPFINKMLVMTGEVGVLLNKVLIFLIFLVPIYLIVNRYVAHYGEYGIAEGALRNAGFSVALLILIIVFTYTTVNLDAIHNFGPQIDAIFAGEGKIFWWRIAPIALLALL